MVVGNPDRPMTMLAGRSLPRPLAVAPQGQNAFTRFLGRSGSDFVRRGTVVFVSANDADVGGANADLLGVDHLDDVVRASIGPQTLGKTGANGNGGLLF